MALKRRKQMYKKSAYVCRYIDDNPIYTELILPQYEIISSKKLFDKKFKDQSVYFINNSNHKIRCPKTVFKNTHLFGEFINYNQKDNKMIKFHNNEYNDIYTSKVPSIAIVGVGSNTQKFEVQCSLTQNFKRDLYNIYNLSYNPEGIIYGFDYYNFPKTVNFPDIIYSINNIVKDHQKADIHLLNVGGGLKYINKYNKNCYGALVSAYLQSTDIDIVIFTVNTSTPVRYVNEAVNCFNFYGISNIFIIISDYTFDEGSYDSPYALGYYCVDNSKKINYQKQLKKECDNVLLFDDVLSGKLYSKIVDLLY